MKDLDETTLAKLAYEMAINIRPHTAVFADFGIAEDDYYEITKIDYFKRAKEAYTLGWNAVTSTEDRVRIQAAAGTEVLLPVVIRRAMMATEPLTSVIESAKFVAKTAGIGDTKANAGNASDRFIITINLGADTERYNKSITIDPNDIDLGASNGKAIEQRPREIAK